VNLERVQRGDLFGHALRELGNGLAGDVAEKVEGQVIAFGAHPANALPSLGFAQAARQLRGRPARFFRQCHGEEGPHALVHRDLRR
jgi:hypothetical protein